jgi:hypothetical protein
MVTDSLDPVMWTGMATMLVVALSHALRNLWKKTLQDSIEIDESKKHSDLIKTLLDERATHNNDLLTCYDKYNKLVSEYGEILSSTKEARREIEALRVEVRDLKLEIEIQQHSYTKQVSELSLKLDDAIKEKLELYAENIRLKEQLSNASK